MQDWGMYKEGTVEHDPPMITGNYNPYLVFCVSLLACVRDVVSNGHPRRHLVSIWLNSYCM